MAQRAVHRAVHRVRRGRVRRLAVADRAVVRRSEPGAEVAPRAVPRPPARRVGARRGLVVAADAVVLLMAGEAALPVPLRREPVAARPPEIVMVPGRPGIMARYAVVLPVTREARRSGLARFAEIQVNGLAVILDPVAPVRLRPRERNFPGCGFFLWFVRSLRRRRRAHERGHCQRERDHQRDA